MAEAQNKTLKKVWSGYECPACYGIFRVPKGNEHREAICPRCETILRLIEAPEIVSESQGEGGILPPLVETLSSGPSQMSVSASSPVADQTSPSMDELSSDVRPKVRKRRKKIKSSLDPDWERTEHARRREEAWKLPIILLLVGILVLAATLVSVEFFKKKNSGKQSRSTILIAPEVQEMGLRDEPEDTQQEIDSLIDVESDREMILETVRLFLEAESLEEILLMVREVENISSKMKQYYAERPYEPEVVKKVAEDGAFSMVDDLVSVNVVLGDYVIRPIALEKAGGRFLIDWESWVGYSELSWERFFDIKPRRGREFRVLVSPVDYFNFDFSDDRRWQSFQITSSDKSTVVYGYVPADSPMVRKLVPMDPSLQESAFVLKLKYPLESRSDDQVLIEEVICSGWVTPGD